MPKMTRIVSLGKDFVSNFPGTIPTKFANKHLGFSERLQIRDVFQYIPFYSYIRVCDYWNFERCTKLPGLLHAVL